MIKAIISTFNPSKIRILSMAIEFEFYKTPTSSSEKADNYHVRAVTRKTVSTDEIIEEIHSSTTLTPGDIKAALTALSDILAKRLGSSERVYLDGIGYFQPVLAANKEIEPSKTRAQSIWFKTIRFRADQKLKNKLKYIGTERAGFKRHSAQLTDKQIDTILTRFFTNHTMITRRKLQELCGLTQITAARLMKKLIEEGKIKNIGMTRQPIYVPVQGNYGVPKDTDIK